MKYLFRALGITLLWGIVVFSFANPQPVPPPKEPHPGPEVPSNPTIQAIVDGNNTFALDLLKRLEEKNADKNLVFSPYSIECAFAMLVDGAAGSTQQEIVDVLHFPCMGDSLHRNFRALRKSLDTDDGHGAIDIANSVWYESGYPIDADYLQLTHMYYQGELYPFMKDDDRESLRKQINRWVENQTHDRIPNLLPPGSITDLTRLILANAVYFKQDWAQTFPRENTHDDVFHLANGSTCTTSFMHNDRMQLHYRNSDTFQAIALPYADRRCTMIVVLPGAHKTIDQILKAISRDGFDSVIPAPHDMVPVNVMIPKFEFSLPVKLNSELVNMGMDLPFSTDADFSKLRTDRKQALRIDGVYHQAFVKVDEKGTEAAAATAIVMVSKAMPPESQDTVQFRADRPFLFLIRDNVSGTILFLGQVTDPSQK